jgi:hypothetical protein
METTTENIMAAINRRNIVEFPGCDALGLNPYVPSEKLIADVIVYGVQAAAWYNDAELLAAVGSIENIPGYVKIETMRQYGLVNLDDAFNAIRRLDK